MEKKDMTVKEFAAKMERSYETIIRWLAQDMVPGAYKEEITPTLSIWRIPPEALQMPIPKSGPKEGAKPAKKSSKKGSAAKKEGKS